MKFELKNGRFFFFSIAIWALLATLWMAGAWDLFDEASELLATNLNIEPIVITLGIMVVISVIFLLAGRQLMVSGKGAKVKKMKKQKKRRKK